MLDCGTGLRGTGDSSCLWARAGASIGSAAPRLGTKAPTAASRGSEQMKRWALMILSALCLGGTTGCETQGAVDEGLYRI